MRLSALILGLVLAAPAQAEILVGVAGPLTGQFGVLGNQIKSGAAAAIAAANASGGVNGEALALVEADDACDTRRAVEAARDFIARDVRAVIGHYCSGASLAAAPLYKDAAILMLAPAASAAQLTEAGHWNVFRLAARDDAAVRLAAARIAAGPDGAKVLFIGDGTPRAAALRAAAAATLPRLSSVDVRPGQQGAAALRAALAGGLPDAVIISMPGAEAAQALTALAAQGFTGTAYGDDLLLSDDVAARLDALPYELLAAFPADLAQAPAARAAVDSIRQAGGDPDGAAIAAYAAVQAFAAAAKASGVNDGRAMSRWLVNAQSLDTVMGPLRFDGRGDLVLPPMAWYRWSVADKRFVAE